ncbi:MAG: IS630 family transposase [Opitutales bacterium]|nr:IS630 family transposase [Opitutales bacterium]
MRRSGNRQLIEERFGVTYTLEALSLILKRRGFTLRRPVKAAYEQRPAEVRQWLDETHPKVRAKAEAENAEIWRGDEFAVKLECHHRRGYAPKGHTPGVRQPAKRFHSSLISAVNNQGSLLWMALKESLNAELFIQFLGQLIKGRKRKVILIEDILRVHHSKPVKAWVGAHKDRIELIYLPAYSPDLNPDKHLKNHLKQTVTAERAPRTESELNAKVSVSLYMLKGERKTVRNFFKRPVVAYAA